MVVISRCSFSLAEYQMENIFKDPPSSGSIFPQQSIQAAPPHNSPYSQGQTWQEESNQPMLIRI